MEENKNTYGADVKMKSPMLEKLENFWYYHKWKVIIILFFSIVFAVGIMQMVNKEDPDASVVIAAPMDFYAEYIDLKRHWRRFFLRARTADRKICIFIPTPSIPRTS